ncbi:PaaI family thioesterase [Roseibacterium beibuensis]|uniref:Thioesterase domain-containing protein n=1 Tax=[Roseibacterium] beibuensis TaxID=1193142 RepID=A0ABP9KZJ8_9RHOB|nr:PaaI family thioesterase [Roseibacterium beibuensis]MCS6621920.1 PaaI family thioesterase [Roseibacterium beibuensis]
MTELNPDLREDPYAIQQHLGYEVTGWTEDWARVEMDLAQHVMNRQGIPHGGIHATLLDTAMGYAGCFTGDPGRKQNAMTLSMTVNYVSQPKGRRLIAEGRRVGGGRSTYFAEAELRDETGAVLSRATGVFRYRPPLGQG